MNEAINNYSYNNNLNDFINEYNSFSKDINNFKNDMRLKKYLTLMINKKKV